MEDEVVENNKLVEAKQNLFDELNALNYHNLKAEFTERGIPSAWKSGKPKKELVTIAVQMLDALKKGEDPIEVSEETIEVVSEVEVSVKKVSKEDILHNLNNIKLLLGGCPESHKPVLRAKRIKLEEDLKNLG